MENFEHGMYAMASWQAGINSLMGYFSTVSAYLIVSYLVGKSLNRSQIILVSGLFCIMALYWTWGVVSFFYIAEDAQALAGETRFIELIRPSLASIPVLLIGIVASLKFMWDVRRDKGSSRAGK